MEFVVGSYGGKYSVEHAVMKAEHTVRVQLYTYTDFQERAEYSAAGHLPLPEHPHLQPTTVLQLTCDRSVTVPMLH